ncbi:universal stress protein [Streptomyces sp. NPDC088729]|uniref:universal stress protein n=1 Tax=Streptomyces sp. NPDC088729 TaxID=3365876 RepID=UPI0038216E5A
MGLAGEGGTGEGTALRRVVVGVSGDAGNPGVLHRAAAEARVRGAELRAVLAWQPPDVFCSRGGPGFPGGLAEYREDAVARLRDALATAFGELGPGVAVAGVAVRGTPGPALVSAASEPDDLLVVGTGSRTVLHRLTRPSVARYCLAHAACPVLTLPPSPLEDELRAVHLRNLWRMPLSTRELASAAPPSSSAAR